MEIGLFFGSFNPVHNGHMIIAQYMCEFAGMSEVWMVVSPHNPLKPIGTLLQDYHRLQLVRTAIGDYNKIKASDIEFSLPKPSFTIHTLTYLQERFRDKQFALIMGADNIETIHKWKNYEQILDNYRIYVYPRTTATTRTYEQHKNVIYTSAPIIELSSSFIREQIKARKDVRYMLPESVYNYIDEMNFYRK
ncbi:MAG: nicotinate-nucleotide adenylyltransferase [Bacteroidetes bacterium]|nr:nicotinate-nucleotide adenylyltransferase [Bacteroidota bacterium]